MIRRAVVVAFCMSSVGAAQAPVPANVCWRARPEATCKSWIITEAIAELPVLETSRPYRIPGGPIGEEPDFKPRFVLAGGAMFNTSPHRAFGITGAASRRSMRVEARQRRWLTQASGVDLSAGLARAKTERNDAWAHGLTASAGVSTTYLGVDVRMDLMLAGPEAVSGTFVTLRTGSRAASAVVLSGIAVLGLAIYAMSGAGT